MVAVSFFANAAVGEMGDWFCYCGALDEARKAGSGQQSNWLTDGRQGREACEVSGLTLRLTVSPRHGRAPELQRVCQYGVTFPAGIPLSISWVHMKCKFCMKIDRSLTDLTWNKLWSYIHTTSEKCSDIKTISWFQIRLLPRISYIVISVVFSRL